MQDAKEARQRSAMLRAQSKQAIANAVRTQTAAHKSVNDGLNKKVGETVQLKVRRFLFNPNDCCPSVNI